jgi:Flp pilus assembly pilin Flp
MLHLFVAMQALAGRTVDRAKTRFNEDRGAAVVEYGIIIAFAVLVLGVVLATVGTNISNWFGRIGTKVNELAPAS